MKQKKLLICYIATFLYLLSSPLLGQEVLDGADENISIEIADEVIAAVIAELRDPTSALFKGISFASSTATQYPENTVCGFVNAKNGFGGYVGFSPFFYSRVTENVQISSPSDFRNEITGRLIKQSFRSSGCASILGLN